MLNYRLKDKELSKKEQLKVAFKLTLKVMMDKLTITFSPDKDMEDMIVDETSELLLKEVSIRTDLR